MGGCWPGAYNTGYPHGLPGDVRTPVTLTVVSGGMTITQNGAIVDSKNIQGDVDVQASNVTIRNSRVQGHIYMRNWEGPNNLLIDDTEIGPDGSYPDMDLIGAGNYTCRRCNVHNTTADGGKFGGSDVVIEDSWFHDFKYTDGAHNDGLQTMGISHAIIRHNYFDGSGQLTSGLMIGNEFGDLVDILVENNLFANIGGYAIYGGWNQSTGYQPTNERFINNRFVKGTFGYGPAAYVAPTAVWTGNAYTDGTPIP
jgi:hypothetical protein